ncbi:sigma-54 dependent transcriptional regulator [Geomonas oryzisoli]|uniref:Sigma-54 dependent transcriptional regulator n=1 Tax=Geomonas oryzisoli TaxID=2847992 RepID=A0ABX8JCR2_9BACT|nr:sigma-54 dependent transcriptional regulator [Geomonas oryzisoli]QWV93315.1 sigma-54 dependent transcriptional regulator [Geomonas oryzisoli]
MDSDLYPSFRVLLVDDEPAWLRSLSLALESSAGITNVETCSDSRQVLELMAQQDFGLVLLDLTMPHVSGEELLTQIGERYPAVAVIVVSGLNQVGKVVTCMKLGAHDYYVKTDDEERIVCGVVRAIKHLELQREHKEMTQRFVSCELKHPEAFSAICTADRAMQAMFAYIEAVAKSPLPLLITGESGSGKELLAQATHRLSGCKGEMVAVNVAGLDDTVFADTLFGHLRGAFTGAEAVRRGMIEAAANGTLFLDEIGDLSIASQVKLLRLLQEGEYFPLGSDQPKRLKARVVVATHQNLEAKVAEGTFRRDLFYRLRAHHVEVPPLRERKGDIPYLLDLFLEEAAATLSKKKPTPPPGLVQLLSTYGFPGNVREFKAMVFDAVSTHKERMLSMESFVKSINASGGTVAERVPDQNPFASFEPLPTFANAAEYLLEEAMSRAGGNQTLAARLLGISQPSLWKRLKLTRR